MGGGDRRLAAAASARWSWRWSRSSSCCSSRLATVTTVRATRTRHAAQSGALGSGAVLGTAEVQLLQGECVRRAEGRPADVWPDQSPICGGNASETCHYVIEVCPNDLGRVSSQCPFRSTSTACATSMLTSSTSSMRKLHRPMPDQVSLVRMKREKLRIKEEIERLRHGPDFKGASHQPPRSPTTGPRRAPFVVLDRRLRG